MSTINQVILEGNCTRDAVQKSVNSTKLSSISVAVNRFYKDTAGSFQKEVLFIDVDAWGDKFSDRVQKTCKKGQGVRVVGRLRQNRWDSDGKKFSKMYVVAETVDPVTIEKFKKTDSREEAKELANLAAHAQGVAQETDAEDSGTPDEETAVF